jgi:CubicO group peptidase (beta-lactamase class C family)
MSTVLTNPALPGCSAAVAKHGEVIWADAVGMAQIASGTPLTSDTAFDIASISKHVTAMAILLLVKDGEVRLDEPVAAYLPDAGPWAATTTVTQLLHHTSGLPDYISILGNEGVVIADRVTQEEALATINDVLGADTPMPWEYSNSNYLVLASLVEAVSGQSLADFAEERLFAPMGSSLVIDPLAEYPTIAARYRDIIPSSTELSVGWDVVGDGAIVATPSALASWFDVIRTGLPGYQTIGDDMQVDSVEIPDGGGGAYGAGVFLTPDGAVWHGGGWEGHISYLSMSPDHGTTVAVACNAEAANAQLATIGLGLQEIWFPAEELPTP